MLQKSVHDCWPLQLSRDETEISASLWPSQFDLWAVCVGVSLMWLIVLEKLSTFELRFDYCRGWNTFISVMTVNCTNFYLGFRLWIEEQWGPRHGIGVQTLPPPTFCCAHCYKVSPGGRFYVPTCGWSLKRMYIFKPTCLPPPCIYGCVCVCVSVRRSPEVKLSPLCRLGPREAC